MVARQREEKRIVHSEVAVWIVGLIHYLLHESRPISSLRIILIIERVDG